MNETIQKLRDYANVKNDWYINRQLDILEKQIQVEITKAELNQVTELKNFIKKQYYEYFSRKRIKSVYFRLHR